MAEVGMDAAMSMMVPLVMLDPTGAIVPVAHLCNF
jgi:hypothetical protein